MPIAIVQPQHGRGEDARARPIVAVTRALVASLVVRPDPVRVSRVEVGPTNWDIAVQPTRIDR